MRSGKEFWLKTELLLEEQGKLCVLLVADSKGSSPGKTGFKLVVLPNGELLGTIGGGKMEFDLVENARKDLRERNYSRHSKLLSITHTAEGSDASGMICAGTQKIIQLILDQNDLHRFPDLKTTQKNYFLSINEAGWSFNVIPPEKSGYIQTGDQTWIYSELLGEADAVYIIGAGHVGRALCEIMHFLDFRVVLFDHREDLNTLGENTFYDELIIGEYEGIAEKIRESNQSYVVIVSSSHKSDELVLNSILKKQLRYIGMMGSKSKVQKIFKNIKLEEQLKSMKIPIHAPIGLDISSITAKEIALAIAAEIIRVKNT